MPVFLKQFVKNLALYPVVGPLLRISLWYLLQVLQQAVRKLHHVILNLPLGYARQQKDTHKKLGAILNYYQQLESTVASLPYQPKISVLFPVYKVPLKYLQDALFSVSQQVYPNWELCIVDDASGDPQISEMLKTFQASHPNQVRIAIHEKNRHISHSSNSCLELAQGDYIALLDHDDRLYPNALAEIVRYINLHDQPDILYSDERLIDERGHLLHYPFFKPAFSSFLHLAMNYTTHLSVYRTQLVRKIGGMRPGFEGSQDHDLMLRMCESSSKPVVHVAQCLYQWRAHQDSTASTMDSKPYAAIAGEKAVREAMGRRGMKGDVEWEPSTFHYRMRFSLAATKPKVSILLPVLAGQKELERCLNSIINRTSYPNYEIILLQDDSSLAQSTDQVLSAFQGRLGLERISLLKREGPSNLAALYNHGARHATGEYLLLIEQHTELLSENWLEEMLGLAQQAMVGAVGSKVLSSDDRIRSAGFALSDQEIALPYGCGRSRYDSFYYQMLNTMREVSAVTKICLMIAKENYFKVQGFDERYLPHHWHDIELCLKLRNEGFVHLYTPYVELYDHRVTSPRTIPVDFERFYLQKRYGDALINDPYLNPNFVRHGNFEVKTSTLEFELPESMFRYLLSHNRQDWSENHFSRYLATKKVPTQVLPAPLTQELQDSLDRLRLCSQR